MNPSTDRIEREILIKAPRSRVWRALFNAEEFGDWFGVALKGKSFAAGRRVQGPVTYPGYETSSSTWRSSAWSRNDCSPGGRPRPGRCEKRPSSDPSP